MAAIFISSLVLKCRVCGVRLRLLTCVAVSLAEWVEGCFGFAGPVGGAGPTGAGGHRLAQVVRADLLGVVGGCFTPVCNTATANQHAPPHHRYNRECVLIGIIWNRCSFKTWCTLFGILKIFS